MNFLGPLVVDKEAVDAMFAALPPEETKGMANPRTLRRSASTFAAAFNPHASIVDAVFVRGGLEASATAACAPFAFGGGAALNAIVSKVGASSRPRETSEGILTTGAGAGAGAGGEARPLDASSATIRAELATLASNATLFSECVASVGPGGGDVAQVGA